MKLKQKTKTVNNWTIGGKNIKNLQKISKKCKKLN